MRVTKYVRLHPRTIAWLEKHKLDKKHHATSLGRFIDDVVSHYAALEAAQHVQHSHD